MATRLPIVMVNGQLEQLQAADSLVAQGAYAPGSISIGNGQFVIMAKNLTLTGTQQLVVAGTGCLRIV